MLQEKGEEPAVCPDALERLEDLFERKLVAIPSSQEMDLSKMEEGEQVGGRFVAMYRQGQRDILAEGLAELKKGKQELSASQVERVE